MSEQKKKPNRPPKIPFDEELARVIQTDPKELADLVEEVNSEDKEVSSYVEERRQSIRRGARRTKKQFGI